MIEDWSELYFFPLPDAVSNKPHFLAMKRVGQILVPKVAICFHRQGKWPKGLKYVRKHVGPSGFRCPVCGASVLQHPMLVLPGTVHLCKCTLVAVDQRFHQPDSPEVWQQIQRIYQKAEACAGEFPLPPAPGIFGWN